MKARYDVYQNDAVVGQLYIRPAGLYYQLDCRCNLSSREIMELWMETANGCEKIGILVPYGEEFGIQRRILRKNLEEDKLRFVLYPRKVTTEEEKIPVQSNSPFPRIADLPNGCLVQSETGMMIRFTGE